MNEENRRILPPLILLVVGLVPWFYAVNAWTSSSDLVAGTKAVQGVVVDYESGYESAPRKASALLYYPVVEFTDHAGHTQRFTSKVGAGGELYDVGENISVRYDPLDRRPPIVASFLRLWAKAMLFVLAGLPFVLLGGVRLFLAVSARS